MNRSWGHWSFKIESYCEPYAFYFSLDTSGKPLSLEKEVLEEQKHASDAKHNASVAAGTGSEGDKSNNDGITAQPSRSNRQKKYSFDFAAPIKQRVSDDESSEDEPLATGVTTVQLEHTV